MLPRRNTISDLDLGLYFIPRSYEYEIFGIPNISFFIIFGILDYYLLFLILIVYKYKYKYISISISISISIRIRIRISISNK